MIKSISPVDCARCCIDPLNNLINSTRPVPHCIASCIQNLFRFSKYYSIRITISIRISNIKISSNRRSRYCRKRCYLPTVVTVLNSINNVVTWIHDDTISSWIAERSRVHVGIKKSTRSCSKNSYSKLVRVSIIDCKYNFGTRWIENGVPTESIWAVLIWLSSPNIHSSTWYVLQKGIRSRWSCNYRGFGCSTCYGHVSRRIHVHSH